VAQLLGYHVDVANSAPVASNQLAVFAYDVVLVDLDMPVKNGIELASEIRRGDGPNSGTCLVAVSAGDPRAHGVDTSDPARLWPFDAYEQKPIDERAMKRIVETRARH
jgi:CheY-like chemotaxis protein